MMIGTIMTVSTAHITEEDNEKIVASEYSDTSAPVSAVYDGGFFLFGVSLEDLEMELANMKKEGYSEAFLRLYRYAVQDLGVSMLRIDRDGRELEASGFDMFEW